MLTPFCQDKDLGLDIIKLPYQVRSAYTGCNIRQKHTSVFLKPLLFGIFVIAVNPTSSSYKLSI